MFSDGKVTLRNNTIQHMEENTLITACGWVAIVAHTLMGLKFPPFLATSHYHQSIFSRIGAVLAPQLALVVPTLTPELPSLHMYIFAIVSLLGSGLAIIVPDTVNTQLPDDFEQVGHQT